MPETDYEFMSASIPWSWMVRQVPWNGWDGMTWICTCRICGYWYIVALIDYSQRQGQGYMNIYIYTYVYIYTYIIYIYIIYIHNIYIYIQMTCSHQIPLWSIVPWCPILVGPLHYFWCLNLPNMLFFPNRCSIPISRSWTSAKPNKSICGSGICWSNITCTYVLSHTTQSLAISWLVGGLEHEFHFSIYWECHDPNWLSYFSEGWNQTPTNHIHRLSIDWP